MATLDDIRAALAKIHNAKRDLDPNDDPDASENDPNDDPNNDDGDPLDDPRSYPDDDEDDDDDDEDDFSKPVSRGKLALRCIPRISSTVMLLERLENQAEQKAYDDCMRLAAKRIAAAKPTARPLTKVQRDNAKLYDLRMKTAQAEGELRTKKLLDAQSKRLEKVSLELYRANLTDKERRERDAHTNTMAVWASGICPEASPDWRSQAQAAFKEKKL